MTQEKAQALKSFLGRFGAGLSFLSEENFQARQEALKEAPFAVGLGIDFTAREILVNQFFFDSDPERFLGNIIHEAGHLLVTGDVTTQEWDFFGWEFCVAVETGTVDEWLLSSDDYCVGGEDDFGALTLDERSDILEERVQRALTLGYLNKDGSPLAPAVMVMG